MNADLAKTLGLIFLYVSHSTLLASQPHLNHLLQLYLDCTFMFLAGYFCHRSLEKRGFSIRRFWRDKLATFLVPFWILVAVWALANRVPGRPPAMWAAYATGLRFLELPPSWDGFSLWFASSLVGFFILFSLIGKHRKTLAAAVSLAVVAAWVHFSTVPPDGRTLYWNFYFYIIPFAVGYLWTLGLSDRRVLAASPALCLIGLPAVTVPIAGPLGTFTWIACTVASSLALGLTLTLISLYGFSKLRPGRLTRLARWVGSGALVAYLAEPVLGMWTSMLLFPQYVGGVLENASLQFTLSPAESALRLLVAVPLALLASPLAYRGIVWAATHIHMGVTACRKRF